MKNSKKIVSLVLSLVFTLSLFPASTVKAVVPKNTDNIFSEYQEEVIRMMVYVNDKTKDSQSVIAKVKEDIDKTIGKVNYRRDFTSTITGFSVETQRKNLVKLRKIDNVTSVKEANIYYPAMLSSKEMTQALAMTNNHKINGEGVVVAVLDTGIDTLHKDMRLSDPSKAKIKTIKSSTQTKYTSKVPYGYNFADNNDLVKDDEKVGKSEHGMHVAGIIGANGKDDEVNALKAIKGVAPEAQLLAMKIFSNNPSVKGAYDDDIIAAIEDSVAKGADIINMSLGSPNGFQDETSPVSKAVTKAREAGVLVLIAAGNEQISTTANSNNKKIKNDLGLIDIGLLGSPATSDDAFTVASNNNNATLADKLYWKANGSENQTGYNLANGTINPDYVEVLSAGTGGSTEFAGKDFTGKIALIERGGTEKGTTLGFAAKIDNALNNKAIGVIIYNHADGGEDPVYPNISGTKYPNALVATVIRSQALKMVEATKTGKVEVKMTKESVVVPSNSPISMSNFTSWGATQTLDFKPEITAPGGGIFSTVNNDRYDVKSGTSMATPHAAGLAALLYARGRSLGLTGAKLADFVKVALMNTSKVLVDPLYASNLPYSPRRQGAGLAQVEDAFKTEVLVTYGKEGAVALREFEGDKTFEITLTNYSKDKDYTFDLASDKVLTQGMDKDKYLFEKEAEGFSVSFDKKSVTVAKGSQAKVTVTLHAGNKVNNFVEGFIMLNSKEASQPTLHIPYMGFNGNFGAEQIIDNPIYDGAKTNYANTSIVADSKNIVAGTVILGSGLDDKFLSSRIMFSPNNDGELDKIMIKAALLRNAQEIIYEVTDKNDGSENVLRVLTTEEQKRRPQYEKFLALGPQRDQLFTPDNTESWDGYLYNKETGSYEIAKDGQYYIRIRAKATPTSEYQKVYMPVKVDTKPATVKVLSKEATADGKFVVKYELKDENGIFANIGATLDGVDATEVKEDGTMMTATFPAPPKDKDKGVLVVMAVDNAFNILEYSQLLSDSRVDIVDYDGSITKGTAALVNEEGKIALPGAASKNIKKLKIGYSLDSAEEVKLDSDNRFRHMFQLKEGNYNLYAYGYDEKGELLVNGYMDDVNKKGPYTEKFEPINYDKTAPKLDLTEPVIKDGVAISKDGKVFIVGSVKDDLTDASKIKVSVMGKAVPVDASGNFKTTIDVPLARQVVVSAVDSYRNATRKMFLVKYEDPNDKGKVSFDNLTPFTVLNAQSPFVKDDVFTITGYLTSEKGKLYINENLVVPTSGNKFSYPLKVKQGINTTNVKFVNADGAVLMNYGFKVIYDTKLPEFQLETPFINGDKIYTNTPDITFKGTIADNTLGHVLIINGNLVTQYTELGARGVADTMKAFSMLSKNVKNNDIMKIEFADAVGNFTVFDYKVVMDTVAPVITVKNVEDGKMYEPGVTPEVSVNEPLRDLTVMLNQKVYDGKPITEPGEYVLEARAVDYAGNVSVKTVTFTVNAKPVIETNTITVNENSKVDLKTLVKATDLEDGDLSSYVTLTGEYKLDTPGTYKLTATVKDSNGNVTTKEIELVVKGVPHIVGASDKILTQGMKFDPLSGVSAMDFEDKDLTSKIKVTGTVDTTKVGVYTVTYEVSDSDGNKATSTIKVTVKEATTKPGTDPTPAPGDGTNPTPNPTPGDNTKPAPAPTPAPGDKTKPAPAPGNVTKPAPTNKNANSKGELPATGETNSLALMLLGTTALLAAAVIFFKKKEEV